MDNPNEKLLKEAIEKIKETTCKVDKEQLEKQLHEVTALMAASESMEQFDTLFKKRYGTKSN